jgi:hypothetical protein
VNDEESLDEFFQEPYSGREGSAQRFFYDFKEALTNVWAFRNTLEYTERLNQAFREVDMDFFDRLAAGARAFARASIPQTSGELLVQALQMAHIYLSSQSITPYTLKARRDLAREIYLYEAVQGTFPDLFDLPLLKLPQKLRQKIEHRKKKFPQQNWPRIEARAGVPKAPPASGGRPRKNP